MTAKNYSDSLLSQKLGAKPGVGVVVYFTTSRAELERRFEALRTTIDPADGLWIAWPKKASRIESDLTFDVVQQTGLAAGLVDNKSCAIDERWQALVRLPARRPPSGVAVPCGLPARIVPAKRATPVNE